jgi:hypothetical protein
MQFAYLATRGRLRSSLMALSGQGGLSPAPAGQLTGNRDVGHRRVSSYDRGIGTTADAACGYRCVPAGFEHWSTFAQRDRIVGPRIAVGMAVMPGRFNQQPPDVGVARFGKRALHPGCSRGVLAGHQPDVGADRGPRETRPITDLDSQRQARQRRDAPQTSQAVDLIGPSWRGGHRHNLLVKTIPSRRRGQHRIEMWSNAAVTCASSKRCRRSHVSCTPQGS